jgi:ABC-type multidrug transport system ATPase subunit
MSIAAGEIFGFLGANGARKTTTIRMLCGLTMPTSGSAFIDGLDVWRDRFRLRSKFGYVPPRDSAPTPDLTDRGLDEPTAGLDPVHRQLIWDFLYKVTQSGTTVFVLTH